MTAPLALYLLWHPDAKDAEPLARATYRWFHAPSDDLLRSGMGLPVYFRSQPAAGDSPLPPPIDLDGSELNVLIILADEHMVRDRAWSTWVGELASQHDRVLTVPVALHQSAYRLPETLRRLNFLRVDTRDEPEVDAQAQTERRTPRLLRQLTEVIARELGVRVRPLQERSTGRSSPPMTVFLSHAKRDGVKIAEALRSAIQDHNRMRAFFDDSDLPLGQAFATELNQAAGTDSAAMIAIVTDTYAARPWCRREVALARAPRKEIDHPRCWANRPLLVVDQLTGSPTRNIPELGNATAVRWEPGRALDTIDLLMLEVVLNSYHRLRARLVKPTPGRHVINWAPDPTSLLALQRAAEEPIAEVVYPGNALPEVERRTLAHLFPKIALRTFEDAASTCLLPPTTASGRLVGLSIGFNPDVGPRGLGREHVEEITLRVARAVVEAGGRLAFGGMIGSSGITDTLLTLVRTLDTDDDDEDGGAVSPGARILIYQRWPALPTTAQIASDVGIAEYVLIENPLPADQHISFDPRFGSPERARQDAHALSAMRLAMSEGGRVTTADRAAPRLDARIVLGGLRSDFGGFMPGVLEETLYSLEQGHPVFILGGFGGAAAVLADAILDSASPPELTPEYHRSSLRFRRLEQGLRAHGEAARVDELFGRLGRAVSKVRADMVAGLKNGLDAEQNRRLMRSDHVSQVVDLLRHGMSQLWARA